MEIPAIYFSLLVLCYLGAKDFQRIPASGSVQGSMMQCCSGHVVLVEDPGPHTAESTCAPSPSAPFDPLSFFFWPQPTVLRLLLVLHTGDPNQAGCAQSKCSIQHYRSGPEIHFPPASSTRQLSPSFIFQLAPQAKEDVRRI